MTYHMLDESSKQPSVNLACAATAAIRKTNATDAYKQIFH